MNTQILAVHSELSALEQEHGELHDLIDDADECGNITELDYKRIKKRKLWLKDRITLLRSMLYPDVIA